MTMDRLPPAPPLPAVMPDLHSPSDYSVAAGLLDAPNSMQGRFKTFPIVGGHGQPGRGWKRRATSDPGTMSMWRVQHPSASVAVRTGVAGGIIVLDITGTKGLRALEDRLGRLPEPTIESASAGGVRRL